MKIYNSVYAQMGYSLISGVLLLTIPNAVITLVGFKPSHEPWIAVVGLLALSLCFYYFQIARSGSSRAVRGTIFGRWFFTGIGTVSAIAGIMPKQIIIMMIFEAGLAFWSWQEIKREEGSN